MRIHVLALLAGTAAACNSTGPDADVGLDGQAVATTGQGSTAAPIRVDASGEYRCRRAVTGRFDNVLVPAGARCDLVDARVRGNVKVERGGRLLARGVDVIGNIEGDGAMELAVVGGRIGGNLKLTEGRNAGGAALAVDGGTVVVGDVQVDKTDAAAVRVLGAEIGGNLQVVETITGSELRLAANRVRGDIQVFKNVGRGSQAVRDNWSDQSIQCLENVGPFVGSPNRASDYEGQCRP